MKIGATASYKAEPFMLTVAPMGRTNLVTLGSILFFVSKVSIDTDTKLFSYMKTL